MSDVVRVYRYVRPLCVIAPFEFDIDGYRSEIDSQRGATLVIDMDYDRRSLEVRYSICTHADGEPSFSKKEGVSRALKRNAFTFPMWDGPSRLTGTDLTAYVLKHMEREQYSQPPEIRSDIIRILEMGFFKHHNPTFWGEVTTRRSRR